MVRVFAGILFIVIGGVLASSAAAGDVSANRLRQDVETLSSEAYEGRGLGTEGLGRATDYLTTRFKEVGLNPLGDDGYRQSFAGPDGDLVNLIGVLGDPGSERHVVVAAHYDHLGKGEPGEANHGLIHPGADDNASGIAVLLESARRLSEEEELGHAVVFIAFSGEEKGLLGSSYYVKHPVLPLKNCMAMINLDTVGRLFDGSLTVFGSPSAQEWGHILQGVNYGFGFELELPEKEMDASDHASFGRSGVPAIHVFTGPHEDYHRPGDTADKVDFEGLEKISEFTGELTLYLAGRDEPLTYLPPGAEKMAASSAPSQGGGRRVSFGSIPDFNYAGPGILLSGVIPGSPAEAAGLQEGDKLVEFAGVAIEDLAAFSSVLKGLKPGDEADVVYEREGERHTATVTVVERK